MNVLGPVLLLCLCAKCAFSHSELDDFRDFLEKTAVLDQSLKGGFEVTSDVAADDVISDSAWEQSGKFEGDLILNDRQRRLVAADVVEGLSRNGLRDSTKRWPDNEVVYYIQREHFTGSQVQAIHAGIEDLAQASCVTFRPYKKGDRDAVVIQGNRNGCFSQVGYQGGYQVLNLSRRHPAGRGCFRHGTVVHELLHTLGFFHMQSSADRDDYIDVIWDNIVQSSKHNFRKYNTFTVSDFGVGYDYDSVMHYSARAFSSNGRPTIVPKQRGAQIGQRTGLSDKDTEKLKKMYCDADNSADSVGKTPAPHTHAAPPALPADADFPHFTHRHPKDKKTASNQPFQGHGIGYHQGKTVVIKLPAANTYNLPVRPSIRMFDYFSKTPKALFPKFVQRFGIGKKIKYERPSSISYSKNLEEMEGIFDGDMNKKDIEPTTSKPHKNTTTETSEAVSNIKHNKELLPSDLPSDLTEAFKRLGEIIRSHVYPSQKPSIESSEGETDYSRFFNPGSKDEIMNTNPLEKLNTEIEKKNDTLFSKTIDKKSNTTYPYGKNVAEYGETDASYGTASLFKELMRHKEHKFPYSINFDQGSNYDYKNKDDFSDMYDGNYPRDKNNGEPYKLFGKVVPPAEKGYQVSDIPEEDHSPKVHKPIMEHSYSIEHKDSGSSEEYSMDNYSQFNDELPSKSIINQIENHKTEPWVNINKTRASIYYQDMSNESGDSEENKNLKNKLPIKVNPTTERSYYDYEKYENNYQMKNHKKSGMPEIVDKEKPSGPSIVYETRGSLYRENVNDESADSEEYTYRPNKYGDYQVPVFPSSAYIKEPKSFRNFVSMNSETNSGDISDEDSGFDHSNEDHTIIKMPYDDPMPTGGYLEAILQNSDTSSSGTDFNNSKAPSNVKVGDYSNEYEGSFDKRLSEILKEYKYIDDTTENYNAYRK